MEENLEPNSKINKITDNNAKSQNNFDSEVVKKIEVKEAIEKHKSKSAIFIDVRDSSDIKKTGTILDGLEIPRGLIEFVADEATPLYNNNLKKDAIEMQIIKIKVVKIKGS